MVEAIITIQAAVCGRTSVFRHLSSSFCSQTGLALLWSVFLRNVCKHRLLIIDGTGLVFLGFSAHSWTLPNRCGWIEEKLRKLKEPLLPRSRYAIHDLRTKGRMLLYQKWLPMEESPFQTNSEEAENTSPPRGDEVIAGLVASGRRQVSCFVEHAAFFWRSRTDGLGVNLFKELCHWSAPSQRFIVMF